MSDLIPQANPVRSYLKHKQEIDSAIQDVVESGYYLMGPHLQRFEGRFAQYIGVNHGVGVANGTDAIYLALKSIGVGLGDKVITVANTAVATVAAIEMTGAEVTFIDINEDSFNLDESLVDGLVSKQTKAIVAVHLYGKPAAINTLSVLAQKHQLYLIEDCAQAHGAMIDGKMAGSVGDLACFSFYPTKNLSCMGDGGMVITNDSLHATKLRKLRQYGWENDRDDSKLKGVNSRLSEIQAAVLNVKLKYLDAENEERREIANWYRQGLAELPVKLPEEREEEKHVYHQFVIQVESHRDQLLDYFKTQNIGAAIHYKIPIHRQSAYSEKSIKLPVTEFLAERILSLPIFPGLTAEEVSRVIRCLTDWFNK